MWIEYMQREYRPQYLQLLPLFPYYALGGENEENWKKGRAGWEREMKWEWNRREQNSGRG